jgi:hypothetical protein
VARADATTPITLDAVLDERDDVHVTSWLSLSRV